MEVKINNQTTNVEIIDMPKKKKTRATDDVFNSYAIDKNGKKVIIKIY